MLAGFLSWLKDEFYDINNLKNVINLNHQSFSPSRSNFSLNSEIFKKLIPLGAPNGEVGGSNYTLTPQNARGLIAHLEWRTLAPRKCPIHEQKTYYGMNALGIGQILSINSTLRPVPC